MKQIDEFISNPTVCISNFTTVNSSFYECVFKFQRYKSNAYAKPIHGKIKIKTENGVRQQLQIKSEICADKEAQPATESFEHEKKRLLDTLTNLKTDNQQLTFDLRKKSDECNMLKRENETLVQKTTAMRTKINDLKSHLSHNNTEHKNYVANLVHQNQLLLAQLEQLKSVTAQNNGVSNVSNQNNDGVYEVEQLLDDKIKRNVRYYLVRWKGYTADDDSWERESNLMCPELLKTYKAQKTGIGIMIFKIQIKTLIDSFTCILNLPTLSLCTLQMY